MKVSILCELEKSVLRLYTEVVKDMPSGVYSVSVSKKTMLLYMKEDDFSTQKIVINQIKQFMRDNSYNYEMEIK